MRDNIKKSVKEAILAAKQLEKEEALSFMETLSSWIADCFEKGGKLIVAGNGGSLCDAMHFAEELSGFFRKKRRAYPAICLGDPGFLTCTANDIGYDQVFVRGVEAFGKEGDIFVALTTSGNSENLLLAVQKAKELGLKTAAFLGKGGGKMHGLADLEWIVEGFATSDRIQEAHMAAIHILIEMTEYLLSKKTEEIFA